MKLAREVSFYQERIDASRRFREAEGLDALWRECLDLYRGKHYRFAVSEDRIVINMAKAVVDTILPATALNNPNITLMARDSTEEPQAAIAEGVLNYQFNHLNFKDELNLCLLDALIMGIGIGKTGWRFVEEPVDRRMDEMKQEHADKMAELDEILDDHDDPEGQTALDEQIASSVSSTEFQIVADHPFVHRVSPFDFFMDSTATSEREIGWVAQRSYRPLVDVYHDPRYDSAARRKVQACGSDKLSEMRSGRQATIGSQDQMASEVACIWEYYDLRTGIMCVFADEAGEFLVKPTQQPYKFGHPFEFLFNYQIPEVLYPMGEIESMRELQHELNATRSQLMNHRKKNSRKYLYKKGAFSSAAMGVLQSDDDNALVEVEDGVEFTDAIAPMPVTPVMADLYNAQDQILDNIRMVTAQNEFQLGMDSATRKTATEASIVNDVANGRAEAKRDKYESFCGRIARKILMLDQQFVTGEQVARVVGQDGAAFWFPYTAEDILGEFDFQVEFGSTQPMNLAGKRREAQDLAMALAPFVQMGVVDPVAIARKILTSFGEKNPGQFITPQMPPGMPGMPPGPPQPPMMPLGPPAASKTPRENAESGVSPQMAQLQGQVGLKLPQSPDMRQ